MSEVLSGFPVPAFFTPLPVVGLGDPVVRSVESSPGATISVLSGTAALASVLPVVSSAALESAPVVVSSAVSLAREQPW
jgi:hypothetical protein